MERKGDSGLFEAAYVMSENQPSVNEPLLALRVLIFGFMVIGMTWHFVVREWIPAHHRLDMLTLFVEHWRYRHYFSAYVA